MISLLQLYVFLLDVDHGHLLLARVMLWGLENRALRLVAIYLTNFNGGETVNRRLFAVKGGLLRLCDKACIGVILAYRLDRHSMAS